MWNCKKVSAKAVASTILWLWVGGTVISLFLYLLWSVQLNLFEAQNIFHKKRDHNDLWEASEERSQIPFSCDKSSKVTWKELQKFGMETFVTFYFFVRDSVLIWKDGVFHFRDISDEKIWIGNALLTILEQCFSWRNISNRRRGVWRTCNLFSGYVEKHVHQRYRENFLFIVKPDFFFIHPLTKSKKSCPFRK